MRQCQVAHVAERRFDRIVVGKQKRRVGLMPVILGHGIDDDQIGTDFNVRDRTECEAVRAVRRFVDFEGSWKLPLDLNCDSLPCLRFKD